MKILLIAKRGHFPRAGLDFKMPTEGLLRLYYYRSVDGSLVHLRLRENLYSLFARSCCLNRNSDTWLVLLTEQQPAIFSCSLWHLYYWCSHSSKGENWQQEAQGGQRGKERGIPARHCRGVELPLWVLICSQQTCQPVEQGSQINPFSGALSEFLNFRESHAGITNVRWGSQPIQHAPSHTHGSARQTCLACDVIGDRREMYVNISSSVSQPLLWR